MGPLGREQTARLALDTGSPFSILDAGLAQLLDLTADRAEGPSNLVGPTGPQVGYRIRATRVTVMGRVLPDFRIRCHDLEEGLEVDGVIGLDVIRRGELLLNLPQGRLEFRWN
jgi:hypothetical protein